MQHIDVNPHRQSDNVHVYKTMNPVTAQKKKIGFLYEDICEIYFREACERLDVDLVGNVTAEQVRNGLELDLCIVTGEYFSEEVMLISEAKRQNIPVLHVIDGILEWRNTWEHPQLISPFLQPVLADKIACLGRSQARVIESWGNIGKCEVVGSPRHDYLLGRKRKVKQDNGFSLLVCSARTPYFNDTQKNNVIKGFNDLRKQVRLFGESAGSEVKILWRLGEKLFDELGITDAINHPDEHIVDLLDQADAMITTPSTLILEAMLCDIPVAVLDYCNSPQYVQTAWSITARDHFKEVLDELMTPPQAKLLIQDYFLHDSLECYEQAGPRLTELIDKMLSVRQESIQSNTGLKFPEVILEPAKRYFHKPGQKLDPARLYPDHTVFADYDKAALQSELLHYINKIEQLSDIIDKQSIQINEILSYGTGPLIPRLVYAFPSIRKMLKTFAIWKEKKLENRRREK